MSKIQEVINSTPHNINIIDESGVLKKIYPKSKITIRLRESFTAAEPVDGVPTAVVAWAESDNVPEYVEGRYYIVSQLIQNALPNRKDFLTPKGIVRDEMGNILGCRQFGRA